MVSVAILGEILGSIIFLAIFGLPGLFMLVVGRWYYIANKVLTSKEEADLNSRLSGTIKANGKAQPLNESDMVKSPITGTKSVGYEFEIEAYMNTGRYRGWNRSKHERNIPMFLLDGWTGSAVIDPEDFTLTLSADYQTVITGRDDAPPEILEYVENQDDVSFEDAANVGPIEKKNKVRFTERRIEVDDEITAVGNATQNSEEIPPSSQASTLIKMKKVSGLKKWLGDGPLFLTDHSDKKTEEKYSKYAKASIGFGVFWLAVLLAFIILPRL